MGKDEYNGKNSGLTDSCADVPQEFIDKYHIYTVPMMVVSECMSYRDGIDITAQDVYDMQKTQLLKTSSPTG